jgi:hypothetical protein
MVLHEGGNYNEMLGIEKQPQEAVPAPMSSAPVKESWVHRHPYLATSVGIGGLLVLGMALVVQRTDVDPSRSSGAWGGAGGMFFGTIKNALPGGPTADDIVRLQSPQDSYAAIPIYAPSQDDPEKASGVADITALLAQLVQHTPVTASSNEPTAPDSYSFIPQGLISTEPVKKVRTAAQENLFDYGNDVGTFVKGFEDTHYGSAQILKDHVEDRTNPDKIRALKILGQDLQQLGVDLRTVPNVPEEAKGMHRIYANAYYAVGGNLVLISETTTDEEFVNAITKYNSLVEALSTQFQLLVVLFGTNEVTFSSSDPGNIFMFSPNLSMLQ